MSNFKRVLNILNEGKNIFNEISELTSANDHSKALVVGAEYIASLVDGDDLHKAEGFVDDFKYIKQQHVKAGHLTPKLQNDRTKLAEIFFKFASEWLSEKEFKKFKSCY